MSMSSANKVLSCALLLIIVLFGRRSGAWDAEGHMVVAQLAYNHLDPVTKTQCDNLISVALKYSSTGTSNFVTAACWADDFKSQLGSGIWHYIDLPISLDGTATNGVGTASFDVVRAIRQCISVLQDTNAVPTNQATCLRYLIHFAGEPLANSVHLVTGIPWRIEPEHSFAHLNLLTDEGNEVDALGLYVCADCPGSDG